MSASISTALRECLRIFNVLVTQGEWKTQESQVEWKDELGKLRIWSANVGAHQTGTSSLEYRLRDASHVRDQIIDLLLDLKKLLLDVKEELSPSEEKKEEDATDESQDQDQDDKDELDELLRDTREILQCLFEMSMLIRKPARHDRTLGFDRADTMAFEPYDREHVLQKFPGAFPEVTDRIAQANSRRRQYFKYRERHQAKLAKGLDEDEVVNETTDRSVAPKSSVLLSDTVASQFVESGIISDDTQSTTGLSQTSYAPSLDSGLALTVPGAPPESHDGRPFECPYCFCIISIRNRKAWIKHVFQDLQPYTCVWKNCALSRKSWDSRKEWYKHIFDHSEASSWRTDGTETDTECPLCLEARQATTFERHVGRHLEDLALWVLPRTNNDSDEEHSEDEDLASSIDDARHPLEREQSSDEPGISTLEAGENEPLSETADLVTRSSQLLHSDSRYIYYFNIHAIGPPNSRFRTTLNLNSLELQILADHLRTPGQRQSVVTEQILALPGKIADHVRALIYQETGSPFPRSYDGVLDSQWLCIDAHHLEPTQDVESITLRLVIGMIKRNQADIWHRDYGVRRSDPMSPGELRTDISKKGVIMKEAIEEAGWGYELEEADDVYYILGHHLSDVSNTLSNH